MLYGRRRICQPFLYTRVFQKEFWNFMFLNSILVCHGVLCGRNYQINEHAQDIFLIEYSGTKHFPLFDLVLGLLRNVLRVLQLRTFPSLQTWIRVSKVLSDFFFFFWLMDKLDFFTNPARARCFNTFSANSAPFY